MICREECPLLIPQSRYDPSLPYREAREGDRASVLGGSQMEMGSRDKGLSASNVVIETKEPSITYGIIFSTKNLTRINLQVEQN